jgi:hypothetical protein
MGDQAEAVRAWREVCAKRQAIRDAKTLPARFAALCDYQGALACFVDGHWAQVAALFDIRPPVAVVPAAAANEPTLAPPTKRRTEAQIEALVASARAMLSQTPRPAKARVAAKLGISPGYLAHLLAVRGDQCHVSGKVGTP